MITHEVIIAVVVVELVFAFSVGVICIIFSFNLLRAIKDNPDATISLHSGGLPPSRSTLALRNSFSAVQTPNHRPDEQSLLPHVVPNADMVGRASSVGSEMDIEEPIDPNNPNPNAGLTGVYNTFVSYLRIW